MANRPQNKKKAKAKAKAKQQADKLAASLKLVSTELEGQSPDQSLGELLEIVRNANKLLKNLLGRPVKNLAVQLSIDGGKLIFDFLFEAINVRLRLANESDLADAASYDSLSRVSIELSSLLSLCKETLAAMQPGNAADIKAVDDACQTHQASIQAYLAESKAVKADVAMHKRKFRVEAAAAKVDASMTRELGERFEQIERAFGLLLSRPDKYPSALLIFRFLRNNDVAGDKDVPKNIEKYIQHVGDVVDFSKYAFTVGRTRLLEQGGVSADEVCQECLVECRAVRDKLQQLIAGAFDDQPKVGLLRSSMETVDRAIENLPTMCQVGRAECHAYISYFSLHKTPPAQALACGPRYPTKGHIYQYGIVELPHSDKLFSLKELVPVYVYQANLPEGVGSVNINFSIAYLNSIVAADAEWPIVVLLKSKDCWGVEATLPVSRDALETALTGRKNEDVEGITLDCQLAWSEKTAVPVEAHVPPPTENMEASAPAPVELPITAAQQTFRMLDPFLTRLAEQDFESLSDVIHELKVWFGVADEVVFDRYVAYACAALRFAQYVASAALLGKPIADERRAQLKEDGLKEVEAILANLHDREISEAASSFPPDYENIPEKIKQAGVWCEDNNERVYTYLVLPSLANHTVFQRLMFGPVISSSANDVEYLQFAPDTSLEQLSRQDVFALWLAFYPAYKYPKTILPGTQTIRLSISVNFIREIRKLALHEVSTLPVFSALCQYQAMLSPSWQTVEIDGKAGDEYVAIDCLLNPDVSAKNCSRVLDAFESYLPENNDWIIFDREARKYVEGLMNVLHGLFISGGFLDLAPWRAELSKRYQKQAKRNAEFGQGIKLLNVFGVGQPDYHQAVQKITACFSEAKIPKKPKSKVGVWAIKQLSALIFQYLEKHPAAVIELAEVVFDLYVKVQDFTGMDAFRLKLEGVCGNLVENKDQKELSLLMRLYLPTIQDGLIALHFKELESLAAEATAVTAELKTDITKTLAHGVYDRVMKVLRVPTSMAVKLVPVCIETAVGQAVALTGVMQDCEQAKQAAEVEWKAFQDARIREDVSGVLHGVLTQVEGRAFEEYVAQQEKRALVEIACVKGLLFQRRRLLEKVTVANKLVDELVDKLPLEQAGAALPVLDPRDVGSTESLPSEDESDGSASSAAEMQQLRDENAEQAARIAQLEATVGFLQRQLEQRSGSEERLMFLLNQAGFRVVDHGDGQVSLQPAVFVYPAGAATIFAPPPGQAEFHPNAQYPGYSAYRGQA
jgi:hypothetical protein